MANGITISVYIKWDQDSRIPHEIWTTKLENFSVSIGWFQVGAGVVLLTISSTSIVASAASYSMEIRVSFSWNNAAAACTGKLLQLYKHTTDISSWHDKVMWHTRAFCTVILINTLLYFGNVMSTLTRLCIYPFFSCSKFAMSVEY